MYDSFYRNDGAGAQIQRILSIYLISQKFNFRYIHSTFETKQHNFDFNYNKKFNELIYLPSNYITTNVKIVKINNLSNIDIIKNNNEKDVLFLIASAHKYIDNNPEILDDLFPIKFDFISEKINKKIIIAIHIRRGDVQSNNSNKKRFIPLNYYVKCIENLNKILKNIDHEFNIYSEANIYNEKDDIEILKKYNNLFFHIDEDVIKTFIDLINADILFSGFSSFSYSASMLRRKGIVIYCKFWHNYSNKNILIENPESIIKNKEKILKSLFK